MVAARSMTKSDFKQRIAISRGSMTSSPRPKILELGATKAVRNFMTMWRTQKRSAKVRRMVTRMLSLGSTCKQAGPPTVGRKKQRGSTKSARRLATRNTLFQYATMSLSGSRIWQRHRIWKACSSSVAAAVGLERSRRNWRNLEAGVDSILYIFHGGFRG